MIQQSPRVPIIALCVVIAVMAWSVVRPADFFTWFLEVLPVLIAVPVLLLSYRRFRFTNLVYCLIGAHAIILIIGGHYTYAKMPLFDWIRDVCGFARNHYDRLGHLAQGFIPAIIAREVLLRTSPLKSGKWLSFIVICICLAISAAYELFEWIVAILTGTAASAFLGSQGDVWDTQNDMACALIGATLAVLLLSRYHDRLLAKLND